MLLLQQDITKNVRIYELLKLELDTKEDKKYKIEAIKDSAV